MATISIKSFQLLSRRSYAVMAESMNVQAVSSVTRKTTDMRVAEGSVDEHKETFWMKDPKTGCWIPQNHFDDIDVADLREKVLSKKIVTSRFLGKD